MSKLIRIYLVCLMQKFLNPATLSEGITSKVNCLDDSIKPPKKDKLISIEWFKIRETDFRDKIFKFEFGIERVSLQKIPEFEDDF